MGCFGVLLRELRNFLGVRGNFIQKKNWNSLLMFCYLSKDSEKVQRSSFTQKMQNARGYGAVIFWCTFVWKLSEKLLQRIQREKSWLISWEPIKLGRKLKFFFICKNFFKKSKNFHLWVSNFFFAHQWKSHIWKYGILSPASGIF